MDRRRTDVETALTVSDQVLDANYCESGRVPREESAHVVTTRQPQTLYKSILFSLSPAFLFILPATSNSKDAKYLLIERTSIVLQK